MEIISVNVGKEQIIQKARGPEKTGIYKIPVDSPVLITTLGLAGDEISDQEDHGGVDQAVYVYGASDYAWWAEMLRRPLLPGTFGENLTLSEMESARFSIGDRFVLGEAVLEVTAPRIPCSTLAARMGDPAFAKQFRQAERPGLYCRVIREGYVQAGMPVTIQRYPGETVSAIEMFRDYYERQLSSDTLRRYLQAPIAIRDRVEKEERLKKLQVG